MDRLEELQAKHQQAVRRFHQLLAEQRGLESAPATERTKQALAKLRVRIENAKTMIDVWHRLYQQQVAQQKGSQE